MRLLSLSSGGCAAVFSLVCAAVAACGGAGSGVEDGDDGDATPGGASSGGSSPGGNGGTSGATGGGPGSSTGGTGATSGGGAGAGGTFAAGSGGLGAGGNAGGSATGGTGGAPLPPAPGRAVLVYTGDDGGSRFDVRVEDVLDVYMSAGIAAEMSLTLPLDFAERFGVLWIMNPMLPINAGVKEAAKELVARGGRTVVVMEHCKMGCYGNAEEDNALLAHLGSAIRLNGMGGAPLSRTTLSLTPVPPVTDGVDELVVYYSGSVTGGTPLGFMSGGDTIIAYERLGLGDVVAVADGSMFGYTTTDGDNQRFIANLGVPLR